MTRQYWDKRHHNTFITGVYGTTHTTIGINISENTPPPPEGGRGSADVTWGGNMNRGREKGKKCTTNGEEERKGKKGERKRKKEKEKEKIRSRRVK